MPPDRRDAEIGMLLAAFVVFIAAVLAYRQWMDRRRRDVDLAGDEAVYHTRQDVRRWLGVFVMGLLAVGLVVGTRIPHIVRGRTNMLFVQTWLGVFLLIFALLLLALLDWFATRRYAHRHRRAMLRERDATLRDVMRPRSYPNNGRGGPGGPGRWAPPSRPARLNPDRSRDRPAIRVKAA